MKRIFFIFSGITVLFFSTLLLLPENFQFKVSRFIFGTMPRAVYQTFISPAISPVLKSCLFHQSKLACMLEVEGDPINPNCFINETRLKNKMHQKLPKWAMEQIQQDLSKFPTIRKTELKRYFTRKDQTNTGIVWIQVKDKKVNFIYNSPNASARERMSQIHGSGVIRYVLDYLAKNEYIPDTEFILALDDFYVPRGKKPIPIFTFAKDLDVPLEKDLILIPDWQNLGSIPSMRPRIRTANKLSLWADKKHQLFWRGGKLDSTGFRKKFIAFANEHPDVIDAKFVMTYGNGKKIDKRFVSPEEHLNYQYLISIDGYRCSWERLVWHLHSNSLVFKHQTNQIQWYYKGIKPFKHYIPITDEHSIITQIAWAEAHPREVQTIIQNASTFVEENLSLEDLYHYIAVLLQEYHKKLAP